MLLHHIAGQPAQRKTYVSRRIKHLLACGTKSFPQRWVPDLRRICPDSGFILVGTKADLRTDERAIAQMKEKGRAVEFVPCADAQAMGKEVGADMVLECSAKTQAGLKEIYQNALRVGLLARHYQSTSKTNKTCQRCQKPSKDECLCERRRAKVHGARKNCLRVIHYSTPPPLLPESTISMPAHAHRFACI